jgi:hypothetical protein
MKKFAVVLALVLAANPVLFSLEEGWLAAGTNFGNYFQNDTALGNFYAGSLGINFSSYGFGNHEKNIGFFFNYALLLPYKNPLAANTIENNFNQIVSADFILGPGFKYRINEKFTLHYGIGLSFNLFQFLDRVNDNAKSTEQRYGLGIGGDVGLKFDITDIVYLNLGTTLNYNFANYRVAESTTDNWTNTRPDSSGWMNNFSMFGIRPYIAVGVNYFSESVTTQWGKPGTSY